MSELYKRFLNLLLERIREQVPSNALLAQELSEALDLNIDSAYRRIRGDTTFRADELIVIAQKYNISIDDLTGVAGQKAIPFFSSALNRGAIDFEDYLLQVLSVLKKARDRKVAQVLFAAKDIPVFHLFQFRELSLFKMFFWQRSIFHNPGTQNERFSLEITSEKQERCLDLCRQIAEYYCQIPSQEIWMEETSFSFLKQIAYYHDADAFHSREDAIRLCESAESLFSHLKAEAEGGYKFMHGRPVDNPRQNFTLYLNELMLIDNVISLRYQEGSQTYLIYHNIEFISTEHTEFCNQAHQWIERIMSRSDLISTHGERQRNQIFRRIQDRLDSLKQKI
ncbi:MAG: hypothetical protein EAZ89_07595 [Bacteroidetes bacterium]|nr:MAG: hypothetical protein EAZ89_07595 [Bacteroidota bacterium]